MSERILSSAIDLTITGLHQRQQRTNLPERFLRRAAGLYATTYECVGATELNHEGAIATLATLGASKYWIFERKVSYTGVFK